ncbi:MAG: T9SS type A sorting domain-containing protein [Chlorobi bacterium]|nr:T9SS type A sorting domain-containing protein [Chlorobiota bacterium]
MRLRFLFILYIVPALLAAQVVTSIPEFPSESDSIVVFFHADEGDGGLADYDGGVFAHTGVITNESSSNSDWKHVIGNWGDDNSQPELTRIATNLYILTVGYPREFYNVTDPNEKILQLAFVFRSEGSDGPTGRDVGGADIFLQIYDEGLNVKITDPSDEFSFATVGEQLPIAVTSSLADSLFLYLDDQLLTSTDADEINYSLNIPAAGKHLIIATASDETTTVSDTVSFLARDGVAVEPLPDGIIPGINYIDNNTVTLSLYAPWKEFVYVIGDFNDWEPSEDFEMKLSPDSTTWWLTINGLTAGEEYAFQYYVDGAIKIADPYAEKILDPWNDQYISDATYPNLKEYPFGKTTEIVSILQTNQSEYVWNDNDYVRPKKTDLVIYELLVRDFVSSHNYQTLTDTLDYLQRLGVNAIELMPINEFEGNSSWGYNPSFYFAPDKYYGTEDNLKRFIDECHARGIAVILDVVFNHSFGQSPFVRLYASGTYGPPTEQNPWYNVTARHPFSVGYDFNHESPQTQELLDRNNRYWIEEYHVDGYRFDLSKGFTQKYSGGNVGLWGQYDQSRIDILERMSDQIWNFDPETYVILEHFAENSEEKVLSAYGMMLWGNLNYNYNEATMGYNSGGKSDFGWISYKTRGWSDPHVVGYMESHDEERLMYKNLQYGNSSGDYDITVLNIALNRMKLASAFFYTVPGPKMLWQFGETGYDYSINYPSGTDDDRLTPKPIRWDYMDVETRANLYKTTKALIELKKNYSAFESDDFSLAVSSSTKRILINDDSMNVVVIGNFDVADKSIIPNFQNGGWWYDYFSGDSILVQNTTDRIDLAAGEFHIYTSVKIPSPGDDILSDVKLIDADPITEFKLFQNYPNPFNPTTVIKFAIPFENKATNVTLKIYDALGREVATLVNGQKSGGLYETTFNASNLGSGIYFYRITAGSFSAAKKMILIK